MNTVTGKRARLEQFLTLPELWPSLEFYSGRIIQKMSPKLVHIVIQGEMFSGINAYCRPKKLGRVFSELRVVFGDVSTVPDLSYFRQDRMPDPASRVDRENVTFPPDLVVEVISPGQTVGELTRKIRALLRGGVKLGWLVDEPHRKVLVFRKGKRAEVLGPGDILSGEEVLPGYLLPVGEMFGWIDSP